MRGVDVAGASPIRYSMWEGCTEIAGVVAVMGQFVLAVDWARQTGFSLLRATTYGATTMCMIRAVISRGSYGGPDGEVWDEMLLCIGSGLAIVLVALHCVERVLARRFMAIAHCDWDLSAKRLRDSLAGCIADSDSDRPFERVVVARARSRLSSASLDRTVGQDGVNIGAGPTDRAGRVSDSSVDSVRVLDVLRYLLLFVAFGVLVDLGFGSAFGNWRGAEFEYCMFASGSIQSNSVMRYLWKGSLTFAYSVAMVTEFAVVTSGARCRRWTAGAVVAHALTGVWIVRTLVKGVVVTPVLERCGVGHPEVGNVPWLLVAIVGMVCLERLLAHRSRLVLQRSWDGWARRMIAGHR